jgi:hypothetical protein
LIRIVAAAAAVLLIAVLVAFLVADRSSTARSPEAFCKRIPDVSAISDAVATGNASEIESAASRLRRASKVAPPEIEGSMQALVTYADGLSASVADAGDDSGAIDAALADAVRRQQDQIAVVEAAGDAVQYYAQAICGVDLTRSTTSTGAPPDGTTPG